MARTAVEIIPQEIVDATIDFLEDDTQSLQAVCLVQKAWYHRTRKHLFREVTFMGRKTEARSMQLKQLLDNCPLLGRCIQQLMLGHLAHPPPDFSQVIALGHLLISLTALTFFYIDWAVLSDEMVTFLHELMSNPRMRKVAFICGHNLDVPSLSQFHHLKELHLSLVQPSGSSVGLLKPRASLPVPPTPDDHLRVLHIKSCGKVLKTLVACAESADGTLDLFHPTTLNMDTSFFDDDMEEGWSTILERCAASVENYNVRHDADPVPAQAFALRHFPKLKCFTATLTCYLFGREIFNPLPILLEELDHLSQSDSPGR